MPERPRALEPLLAETPRIRALARRLVGDAATADDVVQATLAAAVAHPPRTDVPLFGWIATVVRNLVRQHRRTEVRRGGRELRAARPEAQPSAAELVARAEQHRELVAAVLALEEPYRETILLRFFEQLPPRAIARRLQLPVATVRTRVARAIERLRADLDRTHGSRAAWLAALLPLARPGAGLPWLWPTLLMTTNTKLLAVATAALALLALYLTWPEPATPAAAAPAAAAPQHVVAGSGPSALAATPPAAATRIALGAPPPTAPGGPAPAAPDGTLHGKAVDASGAGIGELAIALERAQPEDAAPLARTLADGTFAVPAPAGPGRLVARDDRFVTVLAGTYRGTAPRLPPIIMVAPRLSLAGRVVDEDGAPVAGARVHVGLPDGLRSRLREVLDDSEDVQFEARTDELGAFALRAAPRLDAGELHAARDGLEPHRAPLPQSSELALVITLRRPHTAEGMLSGRVVDRGGQPIVDARVAFGVDTTTTAGDGTFHFKLADAGSTTTRYGFTPVRLLAMKEGLQPARFEPPKDDRGEPRWPAWVVLRLLEPTLVIEGTFLDTEGQPLPNARVWVADPTLFGAINGRPQHVESWLAKRTAPSWHFVTTDAQGAFRIEGLADRAYRVAGMDPATLLRAEDVSARGGDASVTLRLPAGAFHPKVAGVVRSHARKPLAGIRIGPMCDSFRMRFEGSLIGTSHASVPGTVTDAEGRFELKNVPKSLVYLRLDGERIVPLEYGRYVEGDSRFRHTTVKELPEDSIESLEIVVDQRCHLQVELVDAQRADVSVLDANGAPLVISVFTGNSRNENERQPIQAGRTSTMSVPDSARTLVLHKGGQEVGRAPLALDPDKPAVLKL